MPDARDIRQTGPDSDQQDATEASGPTGTLPASATTGISGDSAHPIDQASGTHPADATIAWTPDPGLTVDQSSPANASAESLALDRAVADLAQYVHRTVVGTWSHGRIEAADHARLMVPVLLRVLETGVADDAALRDEFLRQARLVALLDHPNLAIGVLEAIGDGPEPYIAFSVSTDRTLEGLGPRTDWLRDRDSVIYDNRRLAELVTDAARGLRALHHAGLVHGSLRPESLRIAARTNRLRLHDLPSMPLGTDMGEHTPPANDLADLAAAFAVLVTGRVAPPRVSRVKSTMRAMRGANRGLDPELAEILSRCRSTEPGEQIASADELITRLEPVTRHVVMTARWGKRLVTMLYECALWLSVYAFASRYFPGPAENKLLLAIGALPIIWFPVVLPFFEICLGWSPGRRVGGLRLVDVSGTPAPRWRVALRALLRLGWLGAAISIGYGALCLLRQVIAIPASWPGGAAIAIAVGVLIFLASCRLTRSRRPIYDVLTGITWGVQQRAIPAAVTEPPVSGSGPGAKRRTAAPDLAGAGERVGQNRLERELGRGGMGTVYAAWDEVLDRPVAVKLITGPRDASTDILSRFEQEARLAAQVRHENVAQVFGVGHDRGRPYMVLELLHGRTLQQLVEANGPVPLVDAWSMIIQAATGLRAANSLGIVHRDIKPSNLMLTYDGVVKVLDFGISKLIVEETQSTDADRAAAVDRLGSDPAVLAGHLTRTGALLGTPLYMSPEQADGRRMDCRSDIYSLGLTLYYLLGGRPPFDCGDLVELLTLQRQTTPPNLEEHVVGLSPERAEILEQMIAKNPLDRFQDYDELLASLRATARLPPLARLEPRLVAATIDAVLLSAMGTAIGAISLSGWLEQAPALLGIGLGFAVPVVGVWRWGTTPGTWALRLRVSRPDGRRVSLVRSLARQITYQPAQLLAPFCSMFDWSTAEYLAYAVNAMVWMISLVLMSLERRQAVHDRVAKTIVTKLPTRLSGSRNRVRRANWLEPWRSSRKAAQN